MPSFICPSVCMRNFVKLFYNEYTCSTAGTLDSALVIVKTGKVEILFVCMAQQKIWQSNLGTCVVSDLLLL